MARGALEAALDTRLAADAEGGVRVGLSFRNQAGAYCRTFTLPEEALAGLACRESAGWRMRMTSATDPAGGEIRQAATETPPPILAAVDAMIVGDVLDADEETRARDAGWRQ
jgi:hypothetical protein